MKIMKRGILLAAVMLLVATRAFAVGPVDFGIKAGVNTGNFDLDKSSLGNSYKAINDSRTGYHAGVFMRVNFLSFHIQPEFLYNWNSYNMEVWTTGTGDENKTKVKVQTLEVPVLAGLDILFLRLNAGPVFNVMNKTSTSKGVVSDVDIMKPSVGFAAGLGIDLMSFSVDVRYNGQFKKSKGTVTISQDTYDIKSNFQGWQFSLGYKF